MKLPIDPDGKPNSLEFFHYHFKVAVFYRTSVWLILLNILNDHHEPRFAKGIIFLPKRTLLDVNHILSFSGLTPIQLPTLTRNKLLFYLGNVHISLLIFNLSPYTFPNGPLNPKNRLEIFSGNCILIIMDLYVLWTILWKFEFFLNGIFLRSFLLHSCVSCCLLCCVSSTALAIEFIE